jgi:hypothetical protein
VKGIFDDCRAITKAPSGARLYSPLVKMPPNILVPTRTPLDTQWIGAVGKDCMLQATCCHPEGTTKNERASFLIGHPIHGNAILACVGSSWQSEGKCDCSDITLNLYHRYASCLAVCCLKFVLRYCQLSGGWFGDG